MFFVASKTVPRKSPFAPPWPCPGYAQVPPFWPTAAPGAARRPFRRAAGDRSWRSAASAWSGRPTTRTHSQQPACLVKEPRCLNGNGGRCLAKKRLKLVAAKVCPTAAKLRITTPLMHYVRMYMPKHMHGVLKTKKKQWCSGIIWDSDFKMPQRGDLLTVQPDLHKCASTEWSSSVEQFILGSWRC